MIVNAHGTYLINYMHIVDELNLMSMVSVCVEKMCIYPKKSIDIQENNGQHNINVSAVNE